MLLGATRRTCATHNVHAEAAGQPISMQRPCPRYCMNLAALDHTGGQENSRTLRVQGPKYGVLGPKYFNVNGIWALTPYYLGPWTLRGTYSIDPLPLPAQCCTLRNRTTLHPNRLHANEVKIATAETKAANIIRV